MEELSILTQFLSDLNNTYPGFPIYVRVDMNSNVKRKMRHSVFTSFASDRHLLRRPTYHHFLDDSAVDSKIDVLLFQDEVQENLVNIVCKFDDPMVTSHHDILVSEFCVPVQRSHSSKTICLKSQRIKNTHARINCSVERS